MELTEFPSFYFGCFCCLAQGSTEARTGQHAGIIAGTAGDLQSHWAHISACRGAKRKPWWLGGAFQTIHLLLRWGMTVSCHTPCADPQLGALYLITGLQCFL